MTELVVCHVIRNLQPYGPLGISLVFDAAGAEIGA